MTKRVLVVEDEFFVGQLALDELTDEGFEVQWVTSGDAAIKILEAQRRLDVLFTDIRMPGEIDGWTLGRIAADLCPEILILYASGYSERAEQTDHPERFISKPYRIADVIKLINAGTGKATDVSHETLR